MRELTFDEVEIVTGGLLGAGPGGDVSYSHPVLDPQEVGGALVAAVGVIAVIVSIPATMPVAIAGAAIVGGVGVGIMLAEGIESWNEN
jgi:hypothetical protein